MSWRSRGSSSAWRQCITPLRQEAYAKGYVARASLQTALDALKAAEADAQDHELAEDLPFLAQQLLGPPVSVGGVQGEGVDRDASTHIALCRLLSSITAARSIRLNASAANLVFGALRQWADAGAADAGAAAAAASAAGAATAVSSASSASAGDAGAPQTQTPNTPCATAGGASPSSLQLEAMTALAALLPEHIGVLSEHERAAQLAALQSLLASPTRVPGRTAETLELQTLALNALAACCGRNPGPAAGSASASTASDSGASSAAASLTADEAGALLSALASLLHACASRSRPVEDGAHCRLYAALLRALQAAVGEARSAWAPRAASLVEGLQRFLTYGAQASLAASGAAPKAGAPPAAGGGPSSAGDAAAAASGGGGGGGRYRPPHLRRKERQTDSGGSYSDSDVSDTEHSGTGSTGAGGSAAVDRFRSSRVRLGALSCIQAMAKADPRVMHSHWTALLPLQAPLQPKPLTPHLLTVLLHDPLIKVRALAASTVAVLLDGPAQRSILAVAEAKTLSGRAPVRGFLTLSLSLGQLLLAAHAGLLAAAAGEASGLVLPGVLRALVVLIAASPYERLPPELLPETIKVLRTRWAALSAAPTAVAAGELAPIQAAYLACLAECLGTKQPIAGLAAYLQQQQQQQQPGAGGAGAGAGSNAGRSGAHGASEPNSPRATAAAGGRVGGGVGGEGCVGKQLVAELLPLSSDPAAAATLRIEALAALKGMAAHYTFAMPHDVWSALSAAAAAGLSGGALPRTPSHPRSPRGPPSRNSSSSLLGSAPSRGSAAPPLLERSASSSSWRTAAAAPASAAPEQGQGAGPASTSPDDKAAQLSVKLISEYLASIARQYGISRADAGAADADGAGGPGPPPSPCVVSLGAAVPRHGQQQVVAVLSPVSVASEEEVAVGMQRLAGMWRDAVAVLVPAATSHTSYMVRSAGLGCLGEVPDPVFAILGPQLQERLLALLSAAAASDVVAAVRAAACKALGAAAAFPPVLAHADLSDQVSSALAGCLRDSVMSVRIAAGWAVANLCDAHRRRLAEAGGSLERDRNAGKGEGEGGDNAVQQRVRSHDLASTSAPGGAESRATGADSSGGAPRTHPGDQLTPPLEPHHYRQLAALCDAAITATQDADKVRANGVRAVGNLLAMLCPELAPGLAACGRSGASAGAGGSAGVGLGAGGGAGGALRPGAVADTTDGLRPQGWARGAGRGAAVGNTAAGSTSRQRPAAGSAALASGQHDHGQNGDGAGCGGSGGGGVQLDTWLDSALSCLQSTLTTGSMKVQWNACYALLGLLRNDRLLAHPRVAGRTAPLLLLLVMLVRDSANFKIRTHAAAALAALPSREAYGDVLPDALLVVASALEGLSSGGGAAAAASGGNAAAYGGKGGSSAGAGAGDADADGGDGRIPNYRYAAGLTAQLRSTLLHLLSLAQPADARRVREALARKADFLHACLREQLAEAVQPIRSLVVTPGGGGGSASGSGGGGEPGGREWLVRRGSWQSASGDLGVRAGAAGAQGSTELELPADPFGLSGGRGTSPREGQGSLALAALLEVLSLRDAPVARSASGRALAASGSQPVAGGEWGAGGEAAAAGAGSPADAAGGLSGSGRPALTVQVQLQGADGGGELQTARRRVAALAAPLRGFAGLLSQLGPACEPVLRDVQQALSQMQGTEGA